MQRRRCVTLAIFAAVFVAIVQLVSIHYSLSWESETGVITAAAGGSFSLTLQALRRSRGTYVIVDARGDLSARLRAVGSASAVAAGLKRSLLVIWKVDAAGSCSCRLSDFLAPPYPFALLELEAAAAADEEELRAQSTLLKGTPPSDAFQTYDDEELYSGPEWQEQSPPVTTTPSLHLFWRSRGEFMNHGYGKTDAAMSKLRQLTLSKEVLPEEDADEPWSMVQRENLQRSERMVQRNVTADPRGSAGWIGVHLCPHHQPTGRTLVEALDPRHVQILSVADGQRQTTSGRAYSTSRPPRFLTAYLPPPVDSCAAVRSTLRFLRGTRAILFASPDVDLDTLSGGVTSSECGRKGVTTTGKLLAAIFDCTDSCCCENACFKRADACAAWHFNSSVEGAQCLLRSTPGIKWVANENIRGSWGNFSAHSAASSNGVDEKPSCREQQAMLQSRLAPWLHLRLPRPSVPQPGHKPLPSTWLRYPFATDFLGNPADPNPSPSSSTDVMESDRPWQRTFLFWACRVGVIQSGYGQEVHTVRRAARKIFRHPDFRALKPAPFGISLLMQLSPVGIGQSPESGHAPEVLEAMRSKSWPVMLDALRRTHVRYVIVDAKNGLGNRMRAIGSAMAFAQASWRPLLVIWVRDRHCDCGFDALFTSPLPFLLLEADLDLDEVPREVFQVTDYMDPAERTTPVSYQTTKHVFFRSGYLMNQLVGSWKYAQQQLQQLTPVAAVQRLLITNHSMIGVHVRTVFDAPLAAGSENGGSASTINASTTGTAALALATEEYGAAAAKKLLQWRNGSRWENFVEKMRSLLKEERSATPLFYLAADHREAYEGLSHALPPGKVTYTKRTCNAQRCDERDCGAMVYSLVDMLNLARTRFILGSTWSSYSEVAAHWGGSGGNPLTLLLAGKDFGLRPSSA